MRRLHYWESRLLEREGCREEGVYRQGKSGHSWFWYEEGILVSDCADLLFEYTQQINQRQEGRKRYKSDRRPDGAGVMIGEIWILWIRWILSVKLQVLPKVGASVYMLSMRPWIRNPSERTPAPVVCCFTPEEGASMHFSGIFEINRDLNERDSSQLGKLSKERRIGIGWKQNYVVS